MRAVARRVADGIYAHRLEVRGHELTVDEPVVLGGSDLGPSPQELLAASLASCTAITMEMYAKRKGWEIGDIAVAVEYTPVEHGEPTRFSLDLMLPASLSEAQRERLRVIASRCPVHRTLAGDVTFTDRITLSQR